MVEEHKQTTIPIPEEVDHNTSNVQILANDSAICAETETKNVVENVVAKEMVEEEEEVTSELKACTITENGAEMGSEDDKFSELEMKAMEELKKLIQNALNTHQFTNPPLLQVFINVPWWYVAVNKMIRPFLTQRTTSKFVIAAPSKSSETLFRYIAPEQVPIQYGGLSKGEEFDTKDGATQIIMKPATKETIEFAVTEACNVTWEVRVLGWDINYGAEFVPNASDAYTIIIQKMKKVGPTQQSIITNTFNIGEPGKVVLTIHNSSSKKKILLYRLKSKPSCD